MLIPLTLPLTPILTMAYSVSLALLRDTRSVLLPFTGTHRNRLEAEGFNLALQTLL